MVSKKSLGLLVCGMFFAAVGFRVERTSNVDCTKLAYKCLTQMDCIVECSRTPDCVGIASQGPYCMLCKEIVFPSKQKFNTDGR